jgi:DNA helicase II / ATP-dependent DNA helicase PcrA
VTQPPNDPGLTEYLHRLNPEQRAAVEAVDGPVLVLAGAGTGKTRVLTTRFAHILLTGRAAPGQVLAVTFTNKAAKEMRERVGHILGRPAEGLWLGTFHALCARMLRRHAPMVGLTSGFTILDSDDQVRLLKQVMEAAHLDIKRWAPPALMGAIQRWKDRGLTPDRVTAAASCTPRIKPASSSSTPPTSGTCCCTRRSFCGRSRTCWRSITGFSGISLWTSIKIQTWCNTCG